MDSVTALQNASVSRDMVGECAHTNVKTYIKDVLLAMKIKIASGAVPSVTMVSSKLQSNQQLDPHVCPAVLLAQ